MYMSINTFHHLRTLRFSRAAETRNISRCWTSRRGCFIPTLFQNIAMLYIPTWSGFVEGPTWNAWRIQNSCRTKYCALPVGYSSAEICVDSAPDWADAQLLK